MQPSKITVADTELLPIVNNARIMHQLSSTDVSLLTTGGGAAYVQWGQGTVIL